MSIESINSILKFTKVLEKDKQLLQVLQKELKNFKSCSVKGCEKCHKGDFCMKE